MIVELSQRIEKLEDQRKYMGKEGKGTLERGNDSKSSGDGVVGGWVDMVESTQLQAPDLPLEKPVCRFQEATVRTGHGTRLVQNRERSTSRLYIVTLLI